MSTVIGKRIKVVDQANIGYAGIATEVNTVMKTITMVDVTNLGTEDRECAVFYPPSTDTIASISFIQSDVKTVMMLDANVPPASTVVQQQLQRSSQKLGQTQPVSPSAQQTENVEASDNADKC